MGVKKTPNKMPKVRIITESVSPYWISPFFGNTLNQNWNQNGSIGASPLDDDAEFRQVGGEGWPGAIKIVARKQGGGKNCLYRSRDLPVRQLLVSLMNRRQLHRLYRLIGTMSSFFYWNELCDQRTNLISAPVKFFGQNS